jgi:conjugal transfer/entry exclusion protein
MTKKVLTQEEISKLKNFRENLVSVTSQIGEIEIGIIDLGNKKEIMRNKFLNLQKEERKIADELERKYGKGNISLETGEFLPIK